MSSGDNRTSKWISWFAYRRGWLAISLLTPAAVIAVTSPLHVRPDTWPYYVLKLLAWLLFAAGALLRWWSTLYVAGKKSRSLISEGPYSITRNPIYLGTLLLTLSVAVLSQSLFLSVAVILVGTLYVELTVRDEERTLWTIHKDTFRDYCERVPRFFPNWRLFSVTPTVEVYAEGLKAELKRTCRWMWIPLLCDILTQCRCESWWPIWFRLP
jgi:protein-S-isoprenylcysteine O-methyltransferase Ste14